jgi:hypothetical protein
MSLSNAERIKLEKIEEYLIDLAHLVKGGGSRNQLNRLLVLAQDTNRKLTARVEELESQMSEVLELVRKLQ